MVDCVVKFSLLGTLFVPWLLRLCGGDTVCGPAADCFECLNSDARCRWCLSINACALVGDSADDPILGVWKTNNCSLTAISNSTSCPPHDFVLPTPTPITTPKKLKCSAARAVLPEEECNESLLDDETDRRGSVMVILPLLAAVLGVVAFFVMVFVWIRCFYNRQVQRDRERDSSLDIVTETTVLSKDGSESHHSHNGR